MEPCFESWRSSSRAATGGDGVGDGVGDIDSGGL